MPQPRTMDCRVKPGNDGRKNARMHRREFIATFAAAATGTMLGLRAARAQPGGMKRVGVLASGSENVPERQRGVAAFRKELEQLGWAEGRNVHIDARFADKPEQFQPLAKALVAMRPHVIVAQTTPVAAAVQRETRTIPIVFTSVSDPIGSGLVASLARPGGNVTGFMLYESGIVGKWLAMLKEIAPGVARVALMANPATTPFDYFVRSGQAAAPSLALEIVPSAVTTTADVERVIETIARVSNGGLLVLPSVTNISHRDVIVALAARHRLPTVYALRLFVTAGGLMSYSVDIVDQLRQAASYVDRILRGAKPADLPVQAPTRYETVVNLKTAKALGFDVPPTLLVRADEVIE
jgi:putative ABC transport system substrate-binding protein